MSADLDGIRTALLGASVELGKAEALAGGDLTGEADPNDLEQMSRRVDGLAELVAAIEEGVGELQRALDEAGSALAAAQDDLDTAQEDGRDE